MDKVKQERTKKEKSKPKESIALYPEHPAPKASKNKQKEAT
jgi:hypothetical protein